MAAIPVTPPSSYALGRNSVVELTFPDSTGAYTVIMDLCISQGTVNIDTDTIEIPSNCQKGWKIKLPGLKSGTVTGTGYIAKSNPSGSTLTGPLNVLKYLSEYCSVNIKVQTDLTATDPDEPFQISAPLTNLANGFFKSSNVSITPDDAVKCDFTIELSGAQNLQGFMAIASTSVTTS